jgi:hypothetical protein
MKRLTHSVSIGRGELPVQRVKSVFFAMKSQDRFLSSTFVPPEKSSPPVCMKGLKSHRVFPDN